MFIRKDGLNDNVVTLSITSSHLLAKFGFLGTSSNTLTGLNLTLGTHDTTTPLLPGLVEFVIEVGLDGLAKGGELGLVLGTDFRKSQGSGGLLVDETSEASLTLDNAIRDTHLAAQSWQPDNQLNWINIMGDDDELGLLVFDQGGDVVKSVLDGVGFLGGVELGSLDLCGGSLGKTLLLSSLGLWLILGKKTEQVGCGVLV